MVDWMVFRLIDWLIDRLIDWLIDWCWIFRIVNDVTKQNAFIGMGFSDRWLQRPFFLKQEIVDIILNGSLYKMCNVYAFYTCIWATISKITSFSTKLVKFCQFFSFSMLHTYYTLHRRFLQAKNIFVSFEQKKG